MMGDWGGGIELAWSKQKRGTLRKNRSTFFQGNATFCQRYHVYSFNPWMTGEDIAANDDEFHHSSSVATWFSNTFLLL